MINPGTLDRRLILEAPVEIADGAGGVTRDYQAITTLWAEVTPLAARSDVDADGRGATVTHRIVLRARPDITTRHRFREGERVYRIVAFRARDGRGRFLDISAEQRTD